MKTENFKTFTASMIAIVTVISALVAWRAAAASQNAGDADFRGLVATVNAEEAAVLSTIKVTEHYQAFLSYTRYNELGYKLYDALQSKPADADALEQQKSDSWGIAYGLQSLFFPSRYLRPDGTYDSQREMDELLADEQRSRDTRAETHFEEGDSLRRKSNLLVQMLILLGVAFWFFTLAQIVEHKINILFAFAGGFLLAVSSFAALIIELVM
jgi:hypothetical protein